MKVHFSKITWAIFIVAVLIIIISFLEPEIVEFKEDQKGIREALLASRKIDEIVNDLRAYHLIYGKFKNEISQMSVTYRDLNSSSNDEDIRNCVKFSAINETSDHPAVLRVVNLNSKLPFCIKIAKFTEYNGLKEISIPRD